MASFQLSRPGYYLRPDRLLQSCASSKCLPDEFEATDLNLQTSQITLPPLQLQQQLAVYQWRAKTELPVVRVQDCGVLSQTQEAVVLTVRTEQVAVRLGELRELPLFKLLYLLKETLIGMERLCDRFGPFLPSPQLVGLTPAGRCRVWLCANFASNCPSPLAADEPTFLRLVCQLFQPCGNRLRNTLLFQQELSNCRSFCQALGFLEHYARENKIAIPSACRLAPKEFRDPHPSLAHFDPSLTLTRAPKFLQNASLRISLKTNSRQLVHLARSPLRENEEESGEIRMKTSGDTAPDLFGSQEAKTPLDHSLTFELARVKSKHTLTFSNERQPSKPAHKTSNESKPSWADSDEQQERAEVESVFSKNNWQRRLQGLFGEGGMKKSIHKGKEKRNTEKCALKLHLLDSLGKNLHESYMHEDMVPNTSEF